MESVKEVKGIRILDKENRVVSVNLRDILSMIESGGSLNWMILVSDVTPLPEEGEFIIALENQINKKENGLYISWDELKSLSEKIYQEIDLTIIGCKNKRFLHRYENNQKMYENCDIVIEMIDSSYWEVFSKDEEFINKLAKKFKEIEFLKLNSA